MRRLALLLALLLTPLAATAEKRLGLVIGNDGYAEVPRLEKARADAEAVAEALTAQGFDTQKIDGKIGPLTINAVRAFQVARGLVPDGYASPRLLEQLRP